VTISRTRRLAGSVVLLGMLTGCSQVYPGSAQRDPGHDADTVNLALLDTGNYPTKPRDPLGNAEDAAAGAVLEGHRLAENVVFPFDVDKTLLKVGRMGTGVMRRPKAVGAYLESSGLAAAVEPHNYITGYAASANDAHAPDFNQNLYLQNAVLVFKTEADAAAAAAAMADASNTRTSAIDNNALTVTALTIPNHPETVARTWSQHFDLLNKTTYSVIAFTPRGRNVLVQRAISQQDTATATDLATRALDQQLPLIDRFTPTAPDQLVNLPKDPSGLIARMLLPDEDNRTVENGTYGPHGALVFQPDLLAAPALFNELGIDLLIEEDGFLTRAKDAASAERFLDSLAGTQAKSGWEDTDGVAGLPAARCMSKKPDSADGASQYWCAIPQDRFVLEMNAGQALVARQKLAAGYLMLTTS